MGDPCPLLNPERNSDEPILTPVLAMFVSSAKSRGRGAQSTIATLEVLLLASLHNCPFLTCLTFSIINYNRKDSISAYFNKFCLLKFKVSRI